jgi:hypothetical protein
MPFSFLLKIDFLAQKSIILQVRGEPDNKRYLYFAAKRPASYVNRAASTQLSQKLGNRMLQRISGRLTTVWWFWCMAGA